MPVQGQSCRLHPEHLTSAARDVGAARGRAAALLDQAACLTCAGTAADLSLEAHVYSRSYSLYEVYLRWQERGAQQVHALHQKPAARALLGQCQLS